MSYKKQLVGSIIFLVILVTLACEVFPSTDALKSPLQASGIGTHTWTYTSVNIGLLKCDYVDEIVITINTDWKVELRSSGTGYYPNPDGTCLDADPMGKSVLVFTGEVIEHHVSGGLALLIKFKTCANTVEAQGQAVYYPSTKSIAGEVQCGEQAHIKFDLPLVEK